MTDRVHVNSRAQELFSSRANTIASSTDRLLAWVMLLQWPVGVVLALFLSPKTWIGTHSQVHIHVWATAVIGALVSSLPVWLAWTRPGQPITRYVLAMAQILWSALLIHATGGRIETHFHIFGSLVILSLYREWRVLVFATAIVAATTSAVAVAPFLLTVRLISGLAVAFLPVVTQIVLHDRPSGAGSVYKRSGKHSFCRGCDLDRRRSVGGR